jgi:2-oxoglutarate dehydrogenase complex dehydrogenase (E1) component-like enzyme
LAKLLNSNTYRIQNYYSLEKCYDKEARIKLSIDFSEIEKKEQKTHMKSRIESDNQKFRSSMAWKATKLKEKLV